MRVARPGRLPIGSRGFGQRILEALCLMLVAAGCWFLAWTQTRGDDLLDLGAGAIVISASSEYESWPALALVDGDVETGWASRRGRTGPNTIVIELPQRYIVESMVFDNSRAQEIDYPGVSARAVEIWLSTTSADDGFALSSTVEATQGGREDFPLPPGSEAQWIKLIVQSNWGNEEFTEIMELEAYGGALGSLPDLPAVAGTYMTNFGPLYLEQAGRRIRGCYGDVGASVVGTLDGRLMDLRWSESPAFGRALLTVSVHGDFLRGLWYEDSELQGSWTGPRDRRDAQPPCEVAGVVWTGE